MVLFGLGMYNRMKQTLTYGWGTCSSACCSCSCNCMKIAKTNNHHNELTYSLLIWYVGHGMKELWNINVLNIIKISKKLRK